MNKLFKIQTPRMPNFYFTESKVGQRQDGLNPDKNKYPIEDFTKDEAEAYGQMMKEEFIKHWTKRVEQKEVL